MSDVVWVAIIAFLGNIIAGAISVALNKQVTDKRLDELEKMMNEFTHTATENAKEVAVLSAKVTDLSNRVTSVENAVRGR